MSYSIRDRKKNIEKMQSETFDLVIIGGGISGAGVARDAVSRGMKVALVEAQDFAAGTSSRSSKLIHGGIRYLENLEFGLVFEALRERRNLFEMAPHLVHPLRFMLPVYKGSRVGMFKMGVGMWLYDLLSLFETPELHERLDVEETMARAPMLNASELQGSYVYSDAYMDDDRLVIETLRSAARGGAVTGNYVRAEGAQFDDGRLGSVVCRDVLTDDEFSIRGRHFVSTVGPWTDQVASALLGEWKKILRPSKGVHLTLQRNRLPLEQAVVMVSDDQKRIVFAIPRHEMVIVGTTDTDYKGHPEDVHTTREDVDYLLHIVESYFPGAAIKEADIMASYAGVRPLVDDGSSSESKTSREHVILSDPRNITFLTGGKYTTYRQMAEDVMGVVLGAFDIEDQVRWGRGQTLVPLNPMATLESIAKSRLKARQWAHESGLDVDTVNFLVERHGAEAKEMLERYGAVARTVGLGHDAERRWIIEALHAIHETMCHNLVDFYLRRVPLFLARKDHGWPLLATLAKVFQNECKWSDKQAEEAKSAVQHHLNFEMGWQQSNQDARSKD